MNMYVRKEVVASLCFIFLSLGIYGQDADQRYTAADFFTMESRHEVARIIQQAPDFFDQTRGDSSQVDYYWANYYFASYLDDADPALCHQLAQQALGGFKRYKEQLGIIKTHYCLGFIYAYYKNDLPGSSDYYEQGLRILEQTPSGVFNDSLKNTLPTLFLINLSENKAKQGQFRAAYEALIQARPFLDKAPNPRQEIAYYSRLVIIHYRLEEYRKALKFSKKLLQLSEEFGEEQYYTMALNNLSMTYANLEQIDSAIYYLQKGYDMDIARGSTISSIKKAGNLSSMYIKKQQYKKAATLAKEALQNARIHRLADAEIMALLRLSQINLAKNRTFQALEQVKKAEIIANTGDHKTDRIAILDLYYQIYAQQQDYQNSLRVYQEMVALRDSIKDQEILAEIENLAAKNQVVIKEKENLQLRQDAEIQDLKLQRSRLYIFSILGLSLVVLMGAFLFWRQRTLLEQRKALAHQERLRRAQMNPHFFFNALASIQSLVAKSEDKKDQLRYIGRFAQLMRQTLEQSFEEFIDLRSEITSLENYLALQKLRFNQLFSYSIEAPDYLLDEVAIPSQLIQPLVENAIEHGFRDIDYPGKINIHFTFLLNDQILRIIVEDNGLGFQMEPEVHRSRSTQIIKDRLAYYRPSGKYRLEYLTKSGSGVKVQLNVPYQKFS